LGFWFYLSLSAFFSTISQLLDLMDGGVSDRCKVLTAETLTIGSCLETLEVDIGAQTNNKLMLGL
jgi:hypothetical protein